MQACKYLIFFTLRLIIFAIFANIKFFISFATLQCCKNTAMFWRLHNFLNYIPGPPTVPFGIPTNPLPPSTSNGFSAPAPIQKPIVVTAEVIMRAKMELYKKDLIEVQNVAVLKEYLWIQGYDELPPQGKICDLNEN